MNMDFALASRALGNIGMAPITREDKEAGTEAWETAKAYYLQTMLEALAQAEWNSAKRRRELAPARMQRWRNLNFKFAYELPVDCARTVELQGQEYFEVEASVLYTDAAPALLLYISNGRRLIDQPVMQGGGSRRGLSWNEQDYIWGGDARRSRRHCPHEDNTVTGGGAGRPTHTSPPEAPPPPEAEEDFPDYREMKLEPNLLLYWEYLLSSKYALRLTDKPELSMLYLNKAQAIGMAASAITSEQAAARRTAQPSWQESLGLG